MGANLGETVLELQNALVLAQTFFMNSFYTSTQVRNHTKDLVVKKLKFGTTSIFPQNSEFHKVMYYPAYDIPYYPDIKPPDTPHITPVP